MTDLDALKARITGEQRITALHALARLVTLLAADAGPADKLFVETTPAEMVQIMRAAFYWLQFCETFGQPEDLIKGLDAMIDEAAQLSMVKDMSKAAMTRL